jgi:hypothetical protein
MAWVKGTSKGCTRSRTRTYTAPARGVGIEGTKMVNLPSSSSSIMNAGTRASSISAGAGFHTFSRLSPASRWVKLRKSAQPGILSKSDFSARSRIARLVGVRTATPTRKHMARTRSSERRFSAGIQLGSNIANGRTRPTTDCIALSSSIQRDTLESRRADRQPACSQNPNGRRSLNIAVRTSCLLRVHGGKAGATPTTCHRRATPARGGQ